MKYVILFSLLTIKTMCVIDIKAEYEMPTTAEINNRLHNAGYRQFAEKTAIGKFLCCTFHTPKSLSHLVNSLLESYELKESHTKIIPKKQLVMELLLAGHKGLIQELKIYKAGALLQ
jgi:hypothetical protein